MDIEHQFLYLIVFITWLECLWNFYLVYRQRVVLKRCVTIPEELEHMFTDETFTKARLYNLDNITFSIIHSMFDTVIGTATILFYLMPYFWKISSGLSQKIGYGTSEIVISIVFMMITHSITSIISLPFHVYQTFVIEEKHGFNKQTPGFFVKDTLKGYVLTQFLIIIVTSPIIYIIQAGGKYFFVYMWIFMFVFMIFFMTIYPEFIAPLFDKYTPLPDGELKSKIEELATQVQFPLTKVYVVEGSKRSAHSNAYFYGFYKNKRIVLFDTLLKDYIPMDDSTKNSTQDEGTKSTDKLENTENDESDPSSQSHKALITDENEKTEVPAKKKAGCSNDEVLAVLAHELGHWKSNHVLKQMIIMQVNLFFLFMAFSWLFQYDIIYRAFGFYDSKPVLIGLLIIIQFIFMPYHFILSLLMVMLSRRYEFQADAFAKSLGRGEPLRTSLIKLSQDNLGFPIYDWLYSAFTHSHPPLLERLKAIEKTE